MHISFNIRTIKIITPSIAIRFYSIWISHEKTFRRAVEFFIGGKRNKVIEFIAALIYPVAALVRRDKFKFVAKNAGSILNDWKFFVAWKIVANIAVKNFRIAFVRSLNQNCNRNARYYIENILPFAFWISSFLIANITAQIENINLCKLFCKTFTQAAHCLFVNPICICHETDNAFIADSVACPTKSFDITVIKRAFKRGVGFSGVGCGDSAFKVRIKIILRVVVSGALPDRIWRIAHNNFNRRFLLLFNALRIFLQRAENL